jgi:hypothetical protein
MNLTRREAVQYLAGLPVIGVALSLTGCNSEASKVEALITGISEIAALVFPQFAVLINDYATKATTFVEFYVMERASTDPPAVQAQKIEAAAAAVILPDLSGLPAEIVSKFTAIGPLVAELVDSVKALAVMIQQTPGGANAFFTDPKHKKLKPMTADQRAKVEAEIAKLRAKLKK